jgi:2-keto-3-deoxy-L-rhamnonate aldolase RhmA
MSLDPVAAKSYLDQRVDFVAVAIDSLTLAKALRSTAAACR